MAKEEYEQSNQSQTIINLKRIQELPESMSREEVALFKSIFNIEGY